VYGRLNERLRDFAAQGKQIKVGLIGAGRMGKGVTNQISRMVGMRVAIIADIVPESAARAYTLNEATEEDIVFADSTKMANRAIDAGQPVVCEDATLVTECNVDVIIEATGIPEAGAKFAYLGIQNGKHIVMLNIEADNVVGPILKRMADRAGVVYAFADGDEPGVLMGLYEWADALGFEVVAAGKSPAYSPQDPYATPDTVAARAAELNLNPKMFCSFNDGSKTQIEMCSFANAAGLVPDVRGMHNPQGIEIQDLPMVYRYKEDGGILNQYGVVEICAPIYTEEGRIDYQKSVQPGVFMVVTTDHPEIAKDMAHFLKVQPGPNFLLHRPYHLCSIETPLSVARAYLYNEPTGGPKGLYSELIALTKRDLKAGEILDGSGGYMVTGRLEKAVLAAEKNLLPFGLADDIKLVKDVPKDEPIRYDDVVLDESMFVVMLRRLQDAHIGPSAPN
jgi:predicted homoserine dehydrogenase-like protein